jgi:hypothetical protein
LEGDYIKGETMNDESALTEMMGGAIPACNIVTVGFENKVSPNWPVVLVRAGPTTVYYDDGTTTELPSRPVNIAPGGKEELFFTQCTTKCCNKITARGLGKNTQDGTTKELEKTYFSDGPDKCMVVARFIVQPKGQVEKSDLERFHATGDISILYELTQE